MDKETPDESRETDSNARSAELVIDGQRLLIAHAHVHSVEPVLDVRMAPGDGLSVGSLAIGEDQWTVYSLDRNLNVIPDVPANRRACVLLKAEHGGVGFLCDEVRVVDNDSLTMVPVPGCMRGDESLTDSLAVIDGKVTCVLAAERLAAKLEAGASQGAAAIVGDVG